MRGRPHAALQVAVIVNDMSAVNVDAKLVKDRSLSRTQEQVVELSNGCICCTLRDDLLQVGQAWGLMEAWGSQDCMLNAGPVTSCSHPTPAPVLPL